MKYVSVYVAAGLLEADMLKAFLEAQGLEVLLSQESVGRTLGLSAGTLGQVNVLVPEDQISDAKQVLNAVDEGVFEDMQFNGSEDEFDSDDLDTA